MLGYVWTVLEPLMMAIVYWFVFTKLMVRTIGEDPYIVFLLSAMLPWQWANGVLRSSMRALSKDAKLVRSTSLPREIWVLRTVGAKFAEFLFAIPVLIAFGILLGAPIHWQVVFVPVAVVIQAVLLLGAGLILAPLATLYGDVQKLMRIVMRLLFYFSPILYGLHDVQQKFKASIGGVSVADIYSFINPFVGIFDLYRAAYFPDQFGGLGRRRRSVLSSPCSPSASASWSSGGSRASCSRRSEWRPSSRPTGSGSASDATGPATSGCATSSGAVRDEQAQGRVLGAARRELHGPAGRGGRPGRRQRAGQVAPCSS